MTSGKKEERPHNVVPLRTPRPCPICRKKSSQDFHPFCSKHCADVDLNRWLKGSYAIPAIEPSDEWSEDDGHSGQDDGER